MPDYAQAREGKERKNKSRLVPQSDNEPVIIDDGGSARVGQLKEKMDGLLGNSKEHKPKGAFRDGTITYADGTAPVPITSQATSIVVIYSGESTWVNVKIDNTKKAKVKLHPKSKVTGIDDPFTQQRLYKIENNYLIDAVVVDSVFHQSPDNTHTQVLLNFDV
jgi:hypothetical protein